MIAICLFSFEKATNINRIKTTVRNRHMSITIGNITTMSDVVESGIDRVFNCSMAAYGLMRRGVFQNSQAARKPIPKRIIEAVISQCFSNFFRFSINDASGLVSGMHYLGELISWPDRSPRVK